ncbi:uncharacterized protein LOC114332058 [Diabrotica virgifera virgifera]|uniref:Uncharacterized protein LOC114332058 n=1 Tax=Diabrotica virgifera virgifera TaxID=50390 RepID=A0A6P7FN51_DIAVI|nr:uncharacterized protein LOC114332058 [Diabrotica virgifera virgifera]
MAFILPDNILETLLCSFCHKYLSVKPTKVYPNRLIQCGRCVDKKEQEQSIHDFEAVESQYGKIAENILFKCVNRFDGCRELLTYSQVKDHEQVCLEKIHECPICGEEMASFFLLRHFDSNHKDAILDCPAFVFKLNDLLEMPSVYIYQEEDNLFFLYISYTKSENTIKLYLVYIGSYELAKNIYHQFTVSSENKEFDVVLDPRLCTDDFFVVDISHMSNLIQIKFKLIDRNLKVLTAPEISNAVRKPVVTNAPLQNQIQHPTKFNLTCYYCKACCIFSLSSCRVKYYYHDKEYNYVCYYCNQFFVKADEIDGIDIPSDISGIMDFFQWECRNCCGEIYFSSMQSHEINCKLGRQFVCPIKNCCEKGIANQMIKHLNEGHKCRAYGPHFRLSKSFSSCYVFAKEYIVFLSVTNTLDLPSSLDHESIRLELLTKTDDDGKIPRALFFNSKNEILTDYSNILSCNLVFVKVFVY